MVFIDKSIIHVVSHFYTWCQSCKMVVPQVILNLKWSSRKESSLTYKSSSLLSGWPMLRCRGRSPTTIGIKVTRSYTWCLKSYTSGVHQKIRFKCQPSTPNASLCINKKHTFYGNWWQRRRDCTKMWKLWESLRQRSRGWTWTWTKREQHWRLWRDQNSWTREAHK